MSDKIGINNSLVKNLNRANVLRILATRGPISRIDISREIGLSKMSVSHTVSRLIEKRIVMETSRKSVNNRTAGRHSILLDIISHGRNVIGIYISRDSIIITLINLKGEILFEAQKAISDTDTDISFLDKIKAGVFNVLNSKKVKKDRIMGIGIACIGPVDTEKGIILNPHNFHNIRNIDIKQFLENATGLDVYVNNDMNASALAEKYFGHGLDIMNFIYFGITNGIGSGLVLNGELYMGTGGNSGEFGHMTVDINGKSCPCGNRGCLELYADIPQIISQYNNDLGKAAKMGTEDMSATWNEIVGLYREKEPAAAAVINKVQKIIGYGLTSAVNIYDPELIVLGHEIAMLDRCFTDGLEEQINEMIFKGKGKKIKVLPSKFLDKAPVIGAGTVLLDKIFTGKKSI